MFLYCFIGIRNIKKLINGYRIALVIFNIGKFIIEGKHTYYMFNPIMGPEFSGIVRIKNLLIVNDKIQSFQTTISPGYMKLTIRMSFCWINEMMSALVNSEVGFWRNATNLLAFIDNSWFMIGCFSLLYD